MAVFLKIEVDTNQRISIEEDSLLVFIDETGDDKASDKNYPIFGLGGCALFSQDYDHLIHTPWTIFKRKILGNTEGVLHASDIELDNISQDELNLIGEFFKNGEFKRFGFILTSKTSHGVHINKYQILAKLICKHIIDITNNYKAIRKLYIFFEHSTGGNKSINKYFREIDFINDGLKVQVQIIVSRKGIVNGLEVADFIIQAAGNQSRNRLNGKTANRKDFSSIFLECNSSLQKFLQVDNLE